MLHIFKKKDKKKDKKKESYDLTGEMFKILDEHLELIAKNQKRIKALLNNAELTSKAIIVQKEALEKLQEQVNELQKLVEQNGGGS